MIVRGGILLDAGALGYLWLGRDCRRRRGWSITGGMFRRHDAPPFEVQWKLHFDRKLTAPELIWRETEDMPDYRPHVAGDDFFARWWTGRDRELAGVRWFGRVWMIGGGA